MMELGSKGEVRVGMGMGVEIGLNWNPAAVGVRVGGQVSCTHDVS